MTRPRTTPVATPGRTGRTATGALTAGASPTRRIDTAIDTAAVVNGERIGVRVPAVVVPQAVAPGASRPARGPRPGWAGVRRHRGAGALVAADCAAGLIGLREVGPDAGPVLPVVLLAVLLAVHRGAGLYRPALAPAALDDVPGIALGAVLAWGMAAAALAATSPQEALGWAELGCATALTALAAVAGRALVYRLRARRARREPEAALVVGAGPAAQEVAVALRAHPEYGLRPVGVAGPGQGLVARQATDHDALAALPLLAGAAEITRAVARNSVRHALVVGTPADAVVELLAARGCRVWRIGGSGQVPHAGGTGHLWGHAVTLAEVAPHARRFGKRALDVTVVTVALIALAPVLGACALAVRLADGPDVLFRQERIGLDGRPFTLLKFRTLRPRDEREAATRWNVAGDHRMSAIGRLLRRTSLDELPQLWNVLRGDMSLVGPRPERPYFVEQFSAAYPGYQDRHRMPAGITGLAQAHGLRGDTSIADRARFDNHYIDSWSLWQDVAIMIRTTRSLFRLGGS